jgi:lysozyme family protein
MPVTEGSSLKQECINHVIDVEGGYVFDPADSGGETNWGVTKRVARKWGYKGPMKDMRRETAFAIYRDRYWDALELDTVEDLSPRLAAELIDTSINLGAGRAAEFLQRSLNVYNKRGLLYEDIAVDRDVGPATIRALKSYLKARGNEGESIMYRTLNSLQGAFYVDLCERRQKDERFVFGWFKNRVS